MCHLVIARLAPDVRVIDLAHGIRGVRAGSVILAQSVVHSPAGATHLAVVDPGVGTDRKPVAIRSRRGDVLIGPDNGLLVRAADALGGAVDAFEITRFDLVSATFHGRDIFAPAAAHVASGEPVEDLGPRIDPGGLVRVVPAPTVVGDGTLEADVMRVDWYGNLQLAATADDLTRAALGDRVEVCGRDAVTGRTFADAEPGALVVYLDSGDHVAVASNGGSARDLLQDPERVTVKRKA